MPVKDGSLVDLTVELKKKTTPEEINSKMKKYAQTKMKGVLQYSEDQLVSTDIIGNSNSSIFDSEYTMQMGNNLFKILSWYDNEWGYSSRMIDMVKLIGQ